MSEIELIVPSKDLLRVTQVLSGHGVFHQVDSGYAGLGSDSGAADSWKEKAATYAALERRVQLAAQALGVREGPPASTDLPDVVDVETVLPALESIEKEVKQATDQLAEERKRLERLQSDLRQLEPVADVDLNMSGLRSSHYLFPMLGVMPAENVTRLQTSLARVPHLFLILTADSKKPVVWLAGTQSNRDVLQRAARSAYLEPLSLPSEYEGTPREVMSTLQREVKASEDKIGELESALLRLAEVHGKRLSNLAWEIHASRTLTDAILRFGRLRHTYVMVGWVPTDELEILTLRLKQGSKEILIETVPANRIGDKGSVPVALQKSKWLRPFQLLVTTYARPRYGELDPTWLIAITFPLLFGAMFGDVGHGLLLAGLGALISSGRVRALKSLKGLGGLIGICGLVSAAFGFLYGSIFGFEDVIPALWLRPGKDPLQILTFAIGAGVVLLVLGFLIGIFNAIVSRDWGHLFFGHNGLAGFALYLSFLGLAVGALGKLPLPPAVLAGLAVVAGLAIMFSEVLIRLVQGERPLIEGGLGTYAIQAPMELFETVISFLSNSLSYVRVGAFAIAHVVLSSVVFLLANLLNPAHGVAYWLVVAIGTVFIVGYEGLIVGIQAMRLSYYEFFSKFFTGGGMRFEPLSLAPSSDE
jgi:V/A-type H+-transporting ATPase subunit I